MYVTDSKSNNHYITCWRLYFIFSFLAIHTCEKPAADGSPGQSLQRPGGTTRSQTSQKTVMFRLAAVRSWNVVFTGPDYRHEIKRCLLCWNMLTEVPGLCAVLVTSARSTFPSRWTGCVRRYRLCIPRFRSLCGGLLVYTNYNVTLTCIWERKGCVCNAVITSSASTKF
jgi:hypothetical protein